ncbi:hypothetical protein WA026_006063 [Henosepilachna vigintioctopunctata]|uniref:Uncharacterized protein n=1 Tax=Henosepilachna vigintioctopunctata TaxID=420089 RepID=A0AAW1THU1_9CUCU
MRRCAFQSSVQISDRTARTPARERRTESQSIRKIQFNLNHRRVRCLRTMRDLASKMAELKFEAPLAQFDDGDEWGSTEFQNGLKNENTLNNINLNKKTKDLNDVLNDFNENAENINNTTLDTLSQNKKNILANGDVPSVADNFTETFSGSLEDLVNTFDDKITKCFGNYEESVENLAPVQVRTQEEIMNECQ